MSTLLIFPCQSVVTRTVALEWPGDPNIYQKQSEDVYAPPVVGYRRYILTRTRRITRRGSLMIVAVMVTNS